MEHVVFYPYAEGGAAFKRVESLDEAMGFVEHLRNSENITEFTVHSLTPVPVSFRAYYHVEVPAADGAVAAVTPPTGPAVAPPSTAPAESTTLPEPVAPIEPMGAVDRPVEAIEPNDDGAPDVEPVEAINDEDQSEEWVAQAPVVEPALPTPAVAPLDAPVAAGPFASAPPVNPKDSDDVVPAVPTGKRTMGFFAR